MQTLAEARPEVNLCTTTPIVQSLTCKECHSVTIQSPEGATPETGYVCRNCSPLSEDDIRFHYDRTQFDHCGPRAQINSLTLIFEHQDKLARCSSIRLLRSKRLGEPWAINATPERILLLPTRQRLAFITVMCCGMTGVEAMFALEEDYASIANGLVKAKASLSLATPKLGRGRWLRARAI